MVIIAATFLGVVVASIVMWLFDKRDFSSYGEALWFSLQTVTTVGYGDVTPESTFGRVVGGIVMLLAIGVISVITAAITSAFIDAAGRERLDGYSATGSPRSSDVEAALGAIAERLERIEQSLARLHDDGVPPSA